MPTATPPVLILWAHPGTMLGSTLAAREVSLSFARADVAERAADAADADAAYRERLHTERHHAISAARLMYDPEEVEALNAARAAARKFGMRVLRTRAPTTYRLKAAGRAPGPWGRAGPNGHEQWAMSLALSDVP